MSPRGCGHRTLGYKDLVADFAEATILMPKKEVVLGLRLFKDPKARGINGDIRGTEGPLPLGEK